MAKNASHSRAFCLELVINLVLFTLCAAVCLQVFAQAFLRSGESGALAQASLRAQSAAEVFKAANGDPEDTARLLYAQEGREGFGAGGIGGAVGGEDMAEALAALAAAGLSGDSFDLYYDGEWAPAEGAEEAVFTLRCSFEADGPMNSLRIVVLKDLKEVIYELSVKKYYDREKAYQEMVQALSSYYGAGGEPNPPLSNEAGGALNEAEGALNEAAGALNEAEDALNKAAGALNESSRQAEGGELS